MKMGTSSIRVTAPQPKVFDTIADARNQLKWHPLVISVDKVSDGAIGKGTEFLGDYKRFGKNPFTISEYSKPNLITFVSPSPQGELRQRFTVAANGNETLVEQTWEMTPKGIFKLIMPLAKPMFSKNLKMTGDALRKYLGGK